jgi:hypothetical protein
MIRQCLLLSLLFILYGCGTRNQTKTTLKVSNSFSITSQGYTGGLIIHGKNLFTGEKFTQSLKDGVQFTTILNKGEWLLSAIGWPSTSKFYGPPHCGKVNTKLSNEQETVYISMDSANCGDPFFSKGKVDTQNNLKKINSIGTCDTFFERVPLPSDTISSVIVKPTTSNNFCDDPNFPADLKSKVGSIRVFGLNKKPHELSYSFGFESVCIGLDSSSTSTFSPNDLRLPLNEIPLAIKTYKDSSCEKPIAEFIFKDGLDQGDITQFDHLLLDDLSSSSLTAGTTPQASPSTHLKLILPSNDLKRGLSPFSALAPSFKKFYNGVTSLYETAPTGNVTYDFRIPYGQQTVVLEEEKDCNQIQLPSGMSCSLSNDGKVMINIGNIGTTTTTNTFTITGSKNYQIIFEASGFDQERSEVQGLIMKLIGHNADQKTARFFNVWEDSNHYGYLSEIRNMFHPNGAGGVVGIKDKNQTFQTYCIELEEDKEIRIFNFEENKAEWYRVVVSNIIENNESNPSNFLCDLTNLKPSSCPDTIKFHKRMNIYNQSFSEENPVMVLRFSCTHPIGYFENLSSRDDNFNSSQNQFHKRIINWNTNFGSSSAHQRFEVITWSKDLNFEERTMVRIFKTSDSDFEGISYDYHSSPLSGSSVQESVKLTRFQSQSSGLDLNFYTTQQNQNSMNFYEIFQTNNYAINSLLTQPPVQYTGTNSFTLSQSYPQPRITGTSITFQNLSGTNGVFDNNSEKINDSLEMKLQTLGDDEFTDSFQNNFLTPR